MLFTFFMKDAKMKSRKMVIAGYKAGIRRASNKKLRVAGLTSRQRAGIKAACTVKLRKLDAGL